MSLLDHAIWWHVYPLGAFGAPIHDRQGDDAGHRLVKMEAWLDYVVELGCSGLLLGPIFESSGHGYDTVDHFRIDSRLGDDADFDHLVEQAKARGLSIVLDGVFNHVGTSHPLVAAALAGESNLVRVGENQAGRFTEAWEGHSALANLNHDEPAVADLVTEVMLHWLRRGIAGWRLDVAYAVPSQFWKEVTARVRKEFADAIFIGEVIHGDYPAIAKAGGLDSITQYELWKAIGSSITDANFWELAWALERHDLVCAELLPQTFIGNHDVARIATQVGDAGAALALTVLLTLPGMPSIYYGDEQAFRGAKGEGEHADDAIRPPLPATPGELAPQGWWLYRLHQDLIGVRRRHPWITRGRVEVLGKDLTWITYRTYGEGHELQVRLRLEPQAAAEVLADGVKVGSWPRD